MAKRKPKLPPISPERQAIFDHYKSLLTFCSHDWHAGVQRLHEQLETQFDELAKMYGEPFTILDEQYPASVKLTGDRETDANLILSCSFEMQVKRNHSVLMHRYACLTYAGKFFDIFKVQLSRYWTGNITGFDATRFDDEVVHSGDDSMSDVIRAKWGPLAVHVVEVLLNPVKYVSELDKSGSLSMPQAG